MTIELVFDADCPNVEAARASVKAALAQAGLPATWQEWERTSDITPERVRGFGSPTVLINGEDLTGEPAAGASSCRIYRAGAGRRLGAPSAEMVGWAIRRSGGGGHSPRSWRRTLPVLTAAGISLLP